MSKITREHFNRTLSHDEVIDLLGEDAVAKVEAESSDFTNRVSADLDCNNEVEFSASVSLPGDEVWDGITLTAYYYQDKDALEGVGDLGDLPWKVHHFALS